MFIPAPEKGAGRERDSMRAHACVSAVVLFRGSCVVFVLLHVLCYKSLHRLHLAHVTLGHLNNWLNVRLISGNDSSLFPWYVLVTMLNLPTGKIQEETF